MHPRNPYRVPVDFNSLAVAFPALAPYVFQTSKGPTIDFQNDAALRKLTEALLFTDFKLTLKIPKDRLCPPVPNRLNYVLWLEDILHVTNIAYGLQEAPVVGIDIGTGASAIYPMLGCRKNVHWRFVATELDSSSIEHASANIQANALQDKIALVTSSPNGPLLSPLVGPKGPNSPDITYDFTMCNPPFYESRDEVLRSAEAKEVGPNAVCTGADVEMITPGGESAFVSQMVRESIRSGTRCRWYTSMLGKLSSLFAVVKVLNEHEIDNYAITEFVQGQTRRWAIAWSFTNIHLPESIARVANSSLQNIMPKRNTLQRSFKNSRRRPFDILQDVTTSIDGVSSRSTSLIAGEDSVADFVVYASGNTWSRAARRRKQTATAGDDPMHAEDELSQLVCRMRWTNDTSASESVVLTVDWVRGDDRLLFESFTNHVWRKVEALVEK